MSAQVVPYFIDYKTESKGKTLGVTKKHIKFKFGFANNEALQQGFSGANCRGTEHEVIHVWSLKSGKRQILADGKEVHFSETGSNGWTSDRSFQHVFSLRSPGYGSFKCHFISVPAQAGVKPYDLRVNGTSVFQMCKIYQLGTPQMMARSIPTIQAGGGVGHDPQADPYASAEERRLIAQAKLESLRDLRGSGSGATATATTAPSKAEASLISFDDPTPAAEVGGGSQRAVSGITLDPVLEQAPPQVPAAYASSNAMTPWQPPPGTATQQIPGHGAPAPAYGAPAPAYDYSYAQPPQPQQPPAAQQQQQQWNAAPSYTAAPAAYGYGAPPPKQQAPPPQQPQTPSFASPSSAASYGSAPSFAQPPPASSYPQYTGF